VNDLGGDIYELSFQAGVGGNHTFMVSIDDENLANFPPEGVVVSIPEIKADKSTAEKSSRPKRPTVTPTSMQTPSMKKYATIAFLDKVQEKNEETQTMKFKPATTNTVNYIIMIDKSGSMAQGKPTRWAKSAKVVASVTKSCVQHSPEGVAVYFFGTPGLLEVHEGIKEQQNVIDLFTAKKKLAGTTCLEGALQKGFQVHFSKPFSVPTSILVITDGFPNSKSAAINEIIGASKKCQKKQEISISFLQVGNDSKCGEFFKKLEKAQSKGQFPNVAVDCLSYAQVQNIEQLVSDRLK